MKDKEGGTLKMEEVIDDRMQTAIFQQLQDWIWEEKLDQNC